MRRNLRNFVSTTFQFTFQRLCFTLFHRCYAGRISFMRYFCYHFFNAPRAAPEKLAGRGLATRGSLSEWGSVCRGVWAIEWVRKGRWEWVSGWVSERVREWRGREWVKRREWASGWVKEGMCAGLCGRLMFWGVNFLIFNRNMLKPSLTYSSYFF